MPLNMVADQLSASPKLLLWYLHLIFTEKPEVYVKFPTTANPPPIVTQLHKKQLDLYIKHAGENRDSAKVLLGLEAYRVLERSTPLLSFLKAILPLGAIGPAEVGKMISAERRGSAGVSHTLALELAYIMEAFGNESESDALLILELYIRGAESIVLGVSFAQRTNSHAAKLWQTLVDHCLSSNTADNHDKSNRSNHNMGTMFGSLLEAAALCGADLAHLVSQIPPGMQVEGLRPRLVSAVADYRLKVELYASADRIGTNEKLYLCQEAVSRSMRGMRFDRSKGAIPLTANRADDCLFAPDQRRTVALDSASAWLQQKRTQSRPPRYRRTLSIAIR
jgi:vacuolar protein sorting-associated protein 41